MKDNPDIAVLIEPIKPNDPKKARRKFALVIFSFFVLLLAIPAIFIITSILGLTGGEDLDVVYSKTDVDNVSARLGVIFVYHGEEYTDPDDLGAALLGISSRQSGDNVETDGAKEDDVRSPGSGMLKQINLDDYTIVCSEYRQKRLSFNQAEINALANELSPAMFWFDDLQIRLLPAGRLEVAGLFKMKEVLTRLYPELRSEVPAPLVKHVRFFAAGNLSIYENQLSLKTESFRIGPLPIVDPSIVDSNAVYMEAAYNLIPDLMVRSLEIRGSGSVSAEIYMPHRIEIHKK